MLQNFPLVTRAWAFQEKILSRRKIYFTNAEVDWECSQDIQCFCGGIRNASREPATAFEMIQNSFTGEDLKHRERYKWMGIIERYSSRFLTKETDRLPALSALAQKFRTASELGSYLAGNWTQGLVASLKWTASSGKTPTSDYIAPSWSWASAPGGVTFVKEINPKYAVSGAHVWARLIEATCIPASTDPMGAVSRGHIIVVGPVIAMKLTCDQEDLDYSQSDRQLVPWYLVKVNGVYSGERELTFLDAKMTLDETMKMKDKEVLALMIDRMFSLILQRSNTNDEAFERIGVMSHGSKYRSGVEIPMNHSIDKWFEDARQKILEIV
ncbi:uncharacterized protein LY89DRAFT_738165 [Mollisia scopiformis]|uniref:Heterokaryon incompatibility domain-containing protein n=1 Tax=Mollisia scopiformis TaxID=149040 RepID=A0A194WXQ8_MOLSC|nr:uncharacterized protein LY89DRAFT_738165 [Mollisia scopiformis]KUJ12377.1 hypothetical protein LY89DRAFT_738165 [Mollisia scopiformis]